MSQAPPLELDVRPQRGRKAALLVLMGLGLAAGVLFASVWPPDGTFHLVLEAAGFFLILVCIVGRTWCSLYIGGRKIHELVDTGPYSVSRNPLYVFSVIGGIGIGAMFGSIVFAVATGVIVYAVFLLIVRREEALLTHVHGDAFRDYCARVPRFWPRFSAWRDADELTIAPRRVYATYFDSLFFLGAFPLAEAAEWVQQAGWVHPWLLVP